MIWSSVCAFNAVSVSFTTSCPLEWERAAFSPYGCHSHTRIAVQHRGHPSGSIYNVSLWWSNALKIEAPPISKATCLPLPPPQGKFQRLQHEANLANGKRFLSMILSFNKQLALVLSAPTMCKALLSDMDANKTSHVPSALGLIFQGQEADNTWDQIIAFQGLTSWWGRGWDRRWRDRKK